MDAQKVGMAIKKLRLKIGYTQHEIADCLCVTDKAVSKWERGISVPDISIINQLSILLNCDVDNLLEGNISYLENAWQGYLILKEISEIFSGSEIYGKPLVHLLLSYFVLAGIKNIYVFCPERDKKYIENEIGGGNDYGIRLTILSETRLLPSNNTMVIYNNPFVFGPNLTKYFQRAMSRQNGISALTVAKTVGKNDMAVVYDNYKAINCSNNASQNQFCVPILFFPQKYFPQIEAVENIAELNPLYAEPMGNGMIEYSISDEDSLWCTSAFFHYLRKQMGKDIYNLKEIAQNRDFISKKVN